MVNCDTDSITDVKHFMVQAPVCHTKAQASVSLIVTKWEAINRKQITRWQHVSQLKASSFGSC